MYSRRRASETGPLAITRRSRGDERERQRGDDLNAEGDIVDRRQRLLGKNGMISEVEVSVSQVLELHAWRGVGDLHGRLRMIGEGTLQLGAHDPPQADRLGADPKIALESLAHRPKRWRRCAALRR